ncbi:hypothetical protein F4810DRAFT_725082 [Camillea tinctor]|nr:hypothetical protein F4810DRAFT_725082 [Camillea tinctor]
MRFSTAIEIAVLALAHVAACENTWSGSHAVRANAVISERRPLARRQIFFGNGTLTVGGITLGGGRNKAATEEAASDAETAKAEEDAAETEEEASQGEAAEGGEAEAGAAEGEAEAAEGAAEGEEAAAEGITAVDEAEQFSENIGIITDAKGNAVNLGGNLGITKGSDGSTSVGGEAGINIAA